MVRDTPLFIISGALSIGIFATLLYAVMYLAYIGSYTKKYRLNRDPVSVTFHTSKKVSPKVVNKLAEKINSPALVKESLSIDSLFKDTSTPLPSKKKKKVISKKMEKLLRTRKKSEPKKIIKSQEAVKMIDELLTHRLEVNMSMPKVGDMSDGEYNEYYAKIKELLSQNWMPRADMAGEIARVIVSVDSIGNFGYEMVARSSSVNFNEMLLRHLNYLKGILFPPYKHGDSTSIEVYFEVKE